MRGLILCFRPRLRVHVIENKQFRDLYPVFYVFSKIKFTAMMLYTDVTLAEEDVSTVFDELEM